MQTHFTPSLGSVYDEVPPKRILLDVIAGVGEGWLQEIPWEALPLTMTFVKERLSLAAFSSCSYSTLTGSSLWFASIDSGPSLPSDAQSLTAEKSTILGYHCSGWKEGAVGTLSCRSKEGASLQQELKVLKYILSGLSA